MDFCAPPGLLPLADALRLMQQAITPIADLESVPLVDALDRVLAEAIDSPISVPGQDNSAMDGYALRAIDGIENAQLKIMGRAMAGHVFSGEVSANECVRIMTGAVIPTGADCVVMQEQVVVSDHQIQLTRNISGGENIRRAGEDIQRGDLVLPSGKRLSPIDIGMLASIGIKQVKVTRRLRVAVFSTGDELTPLGEPLPSGAIYDSNRYALIALLTRANMDVIDLGLLPDDFFAIENTFLQAKNIADIVISSGGVSVGDADYTKQVLDKLGDIHFWKVAMKPGKPFAFGKLGDGWFFGLPGNPVSAVVTFHQLVLPILRSLSGEAPEPAPTLRAEAATPFKKVPGRTDFQRGIFRCEEGVNKVYSTGMQSSGMLSSMAHANCYIILEQERGSVAPGESVTVLLFDGFIYP